MVTEGIGLGRNHVLIKFNQIGRTILRDCLIWKCQYAKLYVPILEANYHRNRGERVGLTHAMDNFQDLTPIQVGLALVSANVSFSSYATPGHPMHNRRALHGRT